MSLLEKLEKLSAGDTLPMHMPGHKRRDLGGDLPYALDITEIDGFDDLHHRSGILKDLSGRAAKLRNAANAFPLVNGSTLGILSSIYALTEPGDTVIIARNCHKSVYHACEIRNLNVLYVYPELSSEGFFLSVTAEKVKTALESCPDAKLVIITSPTYEGIISDIKGIADAVHSFGAELIVDAAHGAHLGFSHRFPKDALSLGADISVESLHKTLPSLTQTAMLYTAEGIDCEAIEYALDIFETSSPSYPLLVSIEKCCDFIEENGPGIFDEYSKNIEEFRRSVRCLKKLEVTDYSGKNGIYDFDKGKIVISCLHTGMSGFALADKLRRDYHIEPEMSAPQYAICMTSVCDSAENFSRLAEALIDIDSSANESESLNIPVYPAAVKIMSVTKAQRNKHKRLSFMLASGRISAEYLWAYPPGIPVIVPGELISDDVVKYIEYSKNIGCNLVIPGRDFTDEIYIIDK